MQESPAMCTANTASCLSRLRAEWRTKSVLSVLLPAGLAAGYLLIQRHPLFPVTPMPLTALDRLVPFAPGSVYLYESLWLITSIGPWQMQSKRELRAYCKGLLAIAAIAFAVFLLFPTSCPRPSDFGDANTTYRVLTRIDNDRNAFPSLHVALAVFSAACAGAVLRTGPWDRWLGRLVWVWALAIAASTLFTKQHVVADVIAGAALGLLGHLVAQSDNFNLASRRERS